MVLGEVGENGLSALPHLALMRLRSPGELAALRSTPAFIKAGFGMVKANGTERMGRACGTETRLVAGLEHNLTW